MKNSEISKQVLSSIVHHAKLFLVDEMQMETKFDGKYRSVQKIELRKYTTMIGIGGALNFLFYATYDDILLDNLTKIFAYGVISDEEFLEFRESAAGEIANIIIGHAIVDFPNKGREVTFTPPVTIEDAKAIVKTKGTCIMSALLSTLYGNVELNLICSDQGDQNA